MNAEQQQRFNQGRQPFGDEPVVNLPPQANDAQPQQIFNSFINSQMSYTPVDAQRRLPDSCQVERNDVQASCLLSFLNCCDSHNILFGPYCQAHNSILFNRRFLSTTNDGTTPITSGGNCNMIAWHSMFLTSTLPGRTSEDDISVSLQPLTKNLDGISHANVLKFFTLLATPDEMWENGKDKNDFKKFIVEVSQGYIQYVSQHSQVIDKSIVPIIVSPQYYQRIKDSFFWNNVFDMVRNRQLHAIADADPGADPLEMNNNSKVTYHIPLGMFNIVDILTILSFNFDIRHGCSGYLSNCTVYDGIVTIGTATGICNTFKTAKNRPNFCAYPPNVMRILNANFGTPNHNLDYLVFSVEPAVYVEDLIHTLAVAERKNIVPHLAMDKIARKTENTNYRTLTVRANQV